jgi:predicted metal-dependent peptidase
MSVTTQPPMDAMSEIEETAHRMRAEKEAAEAYSVAIVWLLKGRVSEEVTNRAASAFFAILAMRLRPEPCWTDECGGLAATDGKRLLYNPDAFLALDKSQRVGLIAHEVLHCANQHQTRQGSRDMRRCNIAADLAINSLLREAGFHLPAEGCFAGEGKFHDLPKGLSMEEYYPLVPEVPEGMEGGNDPGECGGVIPGEDMTSPAERKKQETDWKIATAQAAQVAKQKGKLPGDIERLVNEIVNPEVPWSDVMRMHVNSYAKNDYNWSKTNRRYAHMGLYLPSLRSNELGNVVVSIDTSGSIGAEELKMFGGELQGLSDVATMKMDILYHDTEVTRHQVWESVDGPLELEARGGGGTSHQCIFEWIEENGIDPTCLVCLTDLYTSFPNDVPNYPVLWVTTGTTEAPFGQVLPINTK